MHCIALAAFLVLALATVQAPDTAAPPRGGVIKDFDAPEFESAKRVFMAESTTPSTRTSMMRELVRRHAEDAQGLLADVLHDSSAEVRRKAAEWLAILGDERGLAVQARCVRRPDCSMRYESIRHLGNWRKTEYASMVADLVRATLEKGRRPDGSWWGDATDRALLNYGAIALARMGRAEDQDLIITTVSANPLMIDLGLEALGYIDDPRSREILWSVYKSRPLTPTCRDAGLGVNSLLPLSRLGEPLAVQRMRDILQGVGTVPDYWPEGRHPSLCADRAEAFRLRPRDAVNFAETVFDVAAKEPEGPGTRDAWEALGLMRPRGFGERVLKLATSKKQWKYVDRQTLFEAVISIDPSLGDRFWAAFDLEVAPAEHGLKMLVAKGVGYLMFSAGSNWTGD